MSILDRFRKPEIRSSDVTEETLLRSFIGDSEGMTKEKALEIPTVQACLNVLTNTICALPIRLYHRLDDGTVEVVDKDPRITMLNDDTGDTLTAKMFWRAILQDYYLGKGGFAYIKKEKRQYAGLFYVNEQDIAISRNYDPIFKEYMILVNGTTYLPEDFFKILRKTKDGSRSISIVDENPLVLNVAYTELKLEYALAKKGGISRGFLQSDHELTESTFQRLKDGFRRLYSGSDENIIVLNKGVTYHAASSTPAELQMNENKSSNAEEICKLFGIPASMICGSRTGNSMTDNDMTQFIRACVAVMTDIECSLNRDFLRDVEKGAYYWAFDTKDLTRGSIKERYEAYRIGLEKNFLQIDEVRTQEGMEPLGIDWIQLNLNTVLYNPDTHEIYTPNTNAAANLDTGAGTIQPEQEPRAEQQNVIVVGAPGSGKTTWVQDQMQDGDIVLDMDKIRSALIGTDAEHQSRPDLTHILSMIGWAVRKGIEEGDVSGKAYLITTETDRLKLAQWAQQINAEIHVMETDAEECKERVSDREDKELYYELIDQWFAEWEGGEADESGTES